MSKKHAKRITALLLAVIMSAMMLLGGCSKTEENGQIPDTENAEGASKEIVVLFTSDVHCGVDENWGYAGLQQIRDTLKSKGINVLLVDDGDAIQGAPIGTFSKGKAIADLMNKMGYDIAIPGNHEFDYGMDNFLEIAENASFPYICCNLLKKGELVLDPYVIKEIGGRKIGFVGALTPTAITASNPKNFQDEEGNYVFTLLHEDRSGQAFYDAVQKNVDAARNDGAEIVILMGHLGLEAVVKPWDYASIAENTTGIDAILDGHSHDSEQVKLKNKDGKTVLRSACGTKMMSIGWLRISEDGSMNTGLYSWDNNISAAELLGIDNEMSRAVDEEESKVKEALSDVIGKTLFDLTIYDPEAKTEEGSPIRLSRRAETNMGDLVADAIRVQTGADAAFIGGGGIRANIPAGDITKEDILTVMPYSNDILVSEVTGQQILDGLEYGVRGLPEETPGFMQVSGITYEIDMSIPSSVTVDENNMFSGVNGEYRVKNVTICGEPIDLEKKYTLASEDYYIKNGGDGLAMFKKEDVIASMMVDNQALIDYISVTLGGVVGEEYSDPYGQGRITAIN